MRALCVFLQLSISIIIAKEEDYGLKEENNSSSLKAIRQTLRLHTDLSRRLTKTTCDAGTYRVAINETACTRCPAGHSIILSIFSLYFLMSLFARVLSSEHWRYKLFDLPFWYQHPFFE